MLRHFLLTLFLHQRKLFQLSYLLLLIDRFTLPQRKLFNPSFLLTGSCFAPSPPTFPVQTPNPASPSTFSQEHLSFLTEHPLPPRQFFSHLLRLQSFIFLLYRKLFWLTFIFILLKIATLPQRKLFPSTIQIKIVTFYMFSTQTTH